MAEERVEIKVPANLARLLDRLTNTDKLRTSQEAAKAVAPDLTRDLVERAQRTAGSGPFARGWIAQSFGPGLQIKNTFGVARWIEFPTKPHLIKAKPGGPPLAWPMGRGAFSAFSATKAKAAASWVYTRAVKHPGTKGKYVFKDTMNKIGGKRILEALAREAAKYLKGA